MENFSLLYPENKRPYYKTLCGETYNDLSLDKILDCITENDAEKKIIRDMMMNLDEINSTEGTLKAASLITGISEGQKNYKVCIAPPEGVSYARDIAEKYGVTLDQLKKTMNGTALQKRAS